MKFKPCPRCNGEARLTLFEFPGEFSARVSCFTDACPNEAEFLSRSTREETILAATAVWNGYRQ